MLNKKGEKLFKCDCCGKVSVWDLMYARNMCERCWEISQ
jgi:hypothetical protein